MSLLHAGFVCQLRETPIHIFQYKEKNVCQFKTIIYLTKYINEFSLLISLQISSNKYIEVFEDEIFNH